jgi:hypothetical protein
VNYIFAQFNEGILRPTAVILDLIIRLPRALFGGFHAALIATGASDSVASIVAGFIVAAILVGLIWGAARLIQKIRLKSPSPPALMIGRIAFWAGCAIGIYFLGLTFDVLGQPTVSANVIYFVGGTAAFYPALGWIARYALGYEDPRPVSQAISVSTISEHPIEGVVRDPREISRVHADRLDASSWRTNNESRRDRARSMNPLRWDRRRQLAWGLLMLVGALAGLARAWVESPLYRLSVSSLSGEWANTPRVFLTWLPNIDLYWPWPAFGVLVCGLSFYAFMLIRK